MRARLYRENHPTIDGRLLRDTIWRDERIPLMMLHLERESVYDPFDIIGWVDTVRREDDGWVTGELHTDVTITGVGLACECDFDNADTILKDDVLITTTARLRAVVLGTRPTWEGMVLE